MSRLSEVKKKYPAIDWKVWANADPSKNNKYLDWIGANQKDFKSSDDAKILLLKFEQKLAKLDNKDISKYSVKTLTTALDKAGKSIKEVKEEGAKLIAEIDGAKIYFLNTFEAAKKYVAGTKWCISNEREFNSHCAEDNLFILIKDKEKIAISVSCKIDKLKLKNRRYVNKKVTLYLDNDFDFCIAPFEKQSESSNYWELHEMSQIFRFFNIDVSNASFQRYADKCIEFTLNNKNSRYTLTSIKTAGSLYKYYKTRSISSKEIINICLDQERWGRDKKTDYGFRYHYPLFESILDKRKIYPELFNLIKNTKNQNLRPLIKKINQNDKLEKEKIENERRQKNQDKLNKLLGSKDLATQISELERIIKNKSKVPAAVKPKKVNT